MCRLVHDHGLCGTCGAQRSRGKDVHWPMQLSLRIAPGPTTRASGLRQRSAEAALKLNLKKAKKGWGPLAKAAPDATGSGSEELALWPPAAAAPAALGRPRLGGARRVGRTGRLSERWRCGRAPRDQITMESCTVVQNGKFKWINAHQYRFISVCVDLVNV